MIVEMHWHWLIVIYLFLGGLGAGAYLTSFAAEKGWLGKDSGLVRSGYYISAPVVAIGTILLVFDLGQGLKKPWLLINLLTNFTSVMTWGTYILSAFILVALIKIFSLIKKVQIPAALTWAGAVLALATGTYTGLLLSVVSAIPIWSNIIMPLLFVVSALSTGLSSASLLATLIEKDGVTEGREGQLHLILVGLELILAAVFFGIAFSGLKGPIGMESAQMALSGTYALVFWAFFLGLGILFPLLVYALQWFRSRQGKKISAAQTASSEVAHAAAAEKKHASVLHLVSDTAVLIGGLALRALIVFSALPLWDGFTLPM